MELPVKVKTAVELLSMYDIVPRYVTPPLYRWYLRFRPETAPPVWDASPGYWVCHALATALMIGSVATVVAALMLLAGKDTPEEAATQVIFFVSQFIGWAFCGLVGAALAHETRRSLKREREALGLPAWEAFDADWRPSLERLRSRIEPERFWLRSLAGKSLVTAAGACGLVVFALLAWALPDKAGGAGALSGLVYLVVCLVGLNRTRSGAPMPVQPALWQASNGFWIGVIVAAILWGMIFADIYKFPVDRNILIFAVFCVIAHLWEWFTFAQQKSIALRAERAEQARQLSEARLNALKAQIEPHFIFNTLAHLKTMIRSDPAAAQTMADELSSFLRASLAALRSEVVTLGNELALVRAYLEIARLRMGRRLDTHVEAGDGVDSVAMPSHLLLTLVENAVQHGIEPKTGAGKVAVRAGRTTRDGKDWLVLSVEDDGAGFGRAATSGTGVGLANVRERLASAFGPQATLQLKPNTPQGVIAEMAFPLPPATRGHS